MGPTGESYPTHTAHPNTPVAPKVYTHVLYPSSAFLTSGSIWRLVMSPLEASGPYTKLTSYSSSLGGWDAWHG